MADWRADLDQSSRNKQVREIANVLASLEPGATSTSKLRLAMQFEDTVFKSAESLADYQKTVAKRLKRFQKKYVPTQPAGATEKQRTLDNLRQIHGESIRYVLNHAQQAVTEMKGKHGDEKARQLEQHLDAAKVWAQDLGLLENSTDSRSKPNYNMADEQLERLKSNIERRLENLRGHVVKLADPDRFFVETLEKAEEDCKEIGTSKLLSAETRKLYQQYHQMIMPSSNFDNPEVMLKNSLDVAIHKSIPLPTRSQQNDEKAALIHLEKMRSASTAFLAFMALENKASAGVAPPKLLKKLHSVVNDGIQFVTEVMKEHRKQSAEPEISLQDAWMKPLKLKGEHSSDVPSNSSSDPAAKRARLGPSNKSLVIRSRVLLTRGRKTPPNLLVELQRKGVQLVRPTHGQGSHLFLEFGHTFSMTIYMVPLLVEFRACPPQSESSNNENSSAKDDKKKNLTATPTPVQTPTMASLVPTPQWTSLHHGLTVSAEARIAAETPKKDPSRSKKRSRNLDEEDDRKKSIESTKEENELSSNFADTSHQHLLNVWNVKGDYQTIGHLVQERLRDASAHATRVLRLCFTDAVVVKETSTTVPKNDFEVEILEGQGLLNFLQLCRSTYTPDWKDVVV